MQTIESLVELKERRFKGLRAVAELVGKLFYDPLTDEFDLNGVFTESDLLSVIAIMRTIRKIELLDEDTIKEGNRDESQVQRRGVETVTEGKRRHTHKKVGSKGIRTGGANTTPC